jgi:hypothetical protein
MQNEQNNSLEQTGGFFSSRHKMQNTCAPQTARVATRDYIQLPEAKMGNQSSLKQRPFFVEVTKPASMFQSTFASSRMNRTTADWRKASISVDKDWASTERQYI